MPLPLTNAPSSRATFKAYCLRRLGSPVIKINVSDEQVEDRINDALLMFWDYHFEGVNKAYYKYQITQTDITNKYITLPDNIIGAVQIWEAGDGLNSGDIFSFRYQFSLNDLYPLTQGSILTYHMTMTHLAFLEQMFVGRTPIRYNRYGNLLYIDGAWDRYTAGDYMVVEAYSIVDPTVYSTVWRDRWLCQYATALIKRQWGSNLSKYSGTQILGGVTWNGQQIYSEAIAEIDALEKEMISSYSLPVSDMIG